MTEDEFRAVPQLSSLFPVRFSSGAQWTQFQAYCNDCNQSVEAEYVHGRVDLEHFSPDYRTSEEQFRVTANAWCRNCDVITPICYLLRPTSILGLNPRSGEVERIYDSPRPGRWENFVDRIKSLF